MDREWAYVLHILKGQITQNFSSLARKIIPQEKLNTQLFEACENLNSQKIETLLKKGADVNTTPKGFASTYTPLNTVIANLEENPAHALQCLKILLKHKANPNQENRYTPSSPARTPMHALAGFWRGDIIESENMFKATTLLLQAGGDCDRKPNSTTTNNFTMREDLTPLEKAYDCGNYEFVHAIREYNKLNNKPLPPSIEKKEEVIPRNDEDQKALDLKLKKHRKKMNATRIKKNSF